MSREIKFRGWSGSEMGECYCIYSEGTAGCQGNKDGFLVDIEELMRFTGLQDKNGKEIWEGDIVKDNCQFTDGRDSYSAVEFSQYEDDEGYSTRHHLGWHADGNSLADLHSVCEVVGNIHENLDLARFNKKD